MVRFEELFNGELESITVNGIKFSVVDGNLVFDVDGKTFMLNDAAGESYEYIMFSAFIAYMFSVEEKDMVTFYKIIDEEANRFLTKEMLERYNKYFDKDKYIGYCCGCCIILGLHEEVQDAFEKIIEGC